MEFLYCSPAHKWVVMGTTAVQVCGQRFQSQQRQSRLKTYTPDLQSRTSWVELPVVKPATAMVGALKVSVECELCNPGGSEVEQVWGKLAS